MREREKIFRAFVMIGVPGAGKTTLAYLIKSGAQGGTICSADDYFTDAQGDYKFDASKLGAAHEQCMEKFRQAVVRGDETVIVDNTNVRKNDRAKYAHMAMSYGYQVIEVFVHAGPQEAFERCVHGVSKSTIDRMAMEMTR